MIGIYCIYMEKNNKVKTGKINHLAKDEFEVKNIKLRISMFLDLDVLDAVKKAAKKQGNIGYQTLINQKLRDVFLNEESVEDRLSRLEEAVLKKRA